ncbi:MAG: cytochrome c3 family protein [Desulfobacteraceae bacterium]|nr:cytochrome c3 family protein [Desulfobacteraceae bacterium]
MSKLKSFQLIIIAIIILIALPFIGQSNIKNVINPKGPDVISIDLPSESDGDEMPSVNFMHTLHNQAADSKCTECHTQEDDTFVFKFKRTEEPASMELYHNNCISCHIKTKDKGKKAGPLAAECRSCHGADTRVSDKAIESPWTQIDFDKSLHFIHTTSKSIKSTMPSESDNCSSCHHKYNDKTKQIYYVKGEEESCIYCHKDNTQEDVRSLKDASHDSCVACHTSLKNKEIAAGPLTCIGCHDIKEQAKIKTAENITRLKRNQPDAALITGRISEGENPKYLMNPVAFNHKLHESKTNDCKTCHHNSLKKCNECHTPKGKKDGQFIRLEQIMHDKDSNRSCIGCHTELTKQSDCAGCHDAMPKQQLKDTSCITCHNTDTNKVITNTDAQKNLAETVVANQSNNYSIVKDEKIPEKVIINELTNEYKPSEFPHRKVIKAISKRVEKNNMAKVFHKDQQTLCIGCHHNSPKSLEPPKCASCHGKDTDIINGKPHLKGAYHGQCITCHQKMEVTQVLPTDCNKCHEQNKTAN